MRTARLVALTSLCACFVVVRPPVPRAQAPVDPVYETLAALVTAKMRQYHVPGVAFGVLRAGHATVRGFGVTSVDDPLPVTPETTFPLASISKTVTATTMMRLIEPVTGTTIGDAFNDLVFKPLGLARAFTRVGDIVTYRFALGHRVSAEGDATAVRPFTLGSTTPAGGVAMSMNDLLAYARFHLGDGTTATVARVLTRATLDEMRTPQLRKQATDDDMGIGWHLRTVGNLGTAAHG